MKKARPKKESKRDITKCFGLWADIPDEEIERMKAVVHELRYGSKKGTD